MVLLNRRAGVSSIFAACLLAGMVSGQSTATGRPSGAAGAEGGCSPVQITSVLADLDGARMKASVDRLAGFGTRHTLSETESATRGIGAARRWIYGELSGYAEKSGGRLRVYYQETDQKSAATRNQPVRVVNVIALIRGTRDPDRVYIAAGHYDSRNAEIADAAGDAPGANDNASGTAVVIELARVLSAAPLPATVVLAAVAGEEQGLLGARGLVQHAIAEKWRVEGMIANDIVGGGAGQNGDPAGVRVFSANLGPYDSSSRHFARFIREQAAGFLPDLRAHLVHRLDRFGRAGDHIAFFANGFPAVRFTDEREDFRRQHESVRLVNGVELGDSPEHVSPDHLRRVAGLNAVALVRAACAPGSPANVRVVRNKARAAELTWEPPNGPDVSGYEFVTRETTNDEWQKAVPLGNVLSVRLDDAAIDNSFVGVRAVDAGGNRSPVRSPEEPVHRFFRDSIVNKQGPGGQQ